MKRAVAESDASTECQVIADLVKAIAAMNWSHSIGVREQPPDLGPGIRFIRPVCFQTIYGDMYPSWWSVDEVQHAQQAWEAREGDVFLVCHFPLLGIERLLSAMVEGHKDPWKVGILPPHHYLDHSLPHDARSFIEQADGLSGRRCFSTHTVPASFPAKLPFKQTKNKPPKVVVLVGDPRHSVVATYKFLTHSECRFVDSSLEDFIRCVGRAKYRLFGDYFEHGLAWAEEARKHPDHIRMFDAGRLGSLDPKVVREELGSIADYVGIPREEVSQLVAAAFRHRSNAGEVLSSDRAALRYLIEGDHLLERTGQNLSYFESGLNAAPAEVHELWRARLKEWTGSPYDELRQLGNAAMKGMSGTPPQCKTVLLKGPTAHNSGTCKPCVFALRGICRNEEEMCLYCHADGHPKAKRPRKKTRQWLKAKRSEESIRTPSPSPSPRNQYRPLAPVPPIDGTFIRNLPPPAFIATSPSTAPPQSGCSLPSVSPIAVATLSGGYWPPSAMGTAIGSTVGPGLSTAVRMADAVGSGTVAQVGRSV